MKFIAFGICWHSMIVGVHWDPEAKELTIYPFPTVAIVIQIGVETK